MAAAEAESAGQEKVRQAEDVRQVQNEMFIATFAKRAKDATIASGAIVEEAEAARLVTAADMATTFADSKTMQK